jgi:hypothetical protein
MATQSQFQTSEENSQKQRTKQSDYQDLESQREQVNLTTTLQRARSAPGALTSRDVLQLQSMIGNRALGSLLEGTRQHQALQPQLRGEQEVIASGGVQSDIQKEAPKSGDSNFNHDSISPQSITQRRVIQRAVGFEFQLPSANLWKYSPTRKDTEPASEDFLPYGKKVFEQSGQFHVESDDGEVEFVTKEFGEDKAGLGKMVQAVSNAANFANNFKGFPSYPTTVARVKARYGNGQLVEQPEEVKSHRIGWKGDPASALEDDNLQAKPQTTVGLTLENIIEFARAIMQNEQQWEAEAKTGNVVSKEMKTATDWAQEFSGDFQVVSLYSAQSAPQASKKVKNLVTLVLEFISDSRQGSKVAERYYNEALDHHNQDKSKMKYHPGDDAPLLYPKANHTLMVRNNFRQMFELLDQTEKVDCKTLLEQMYKDYLALSPDDRLYPYGYYSDQIKPQDYYTVEAEKDKLEGPKASEWLDLITSDTPSKSDLPLPGTPQDRGMGALKKMDPVLNNKNAQALIFELRSFEGPIIPDKWVDLAKAVHTIVAQVQSK